MRAQGKALNYAINQWDQLALSLENGEVEIDNNLVENANRPLKLDAKNWLFIGREDTGWRTAVVLTMVVENVRRHGYSPRAYFEWVFERLPSLTSRDDLSQLLPDAWIAQQQSRVPQLQAPDASTNKGVIGVPPITPMSGPRPPTQGWPLSAYQIHQR